MAFDEFGLNKAHGNARLADAALPEEDDLAFSHVAILGVFSACAASGLGGAGVDI